jgi:hypothetical protein
MTMADDSFDAAAAEEARAKAEARRQRILEKSRERMGVVAGERPAGEVPEKETDDDDHQGASSRMQAMRRRRFKKTAQAKEGDETKEKETTQQTKESAEAPVAETTTSGTAQSDTVEDTKTEETQETKKKYKGVAKMRREMIKKKGKKATETKVEESGAVASVPLLRKPPVSPIPIIFHLVAVMLLFLAGVDIGWNQVVFSDVTIYRDITPRREGVGLLNRYMAPSKTTLLDPSKLQETEVWTSQEEFATCEEDEEVYVPNIDPIFHVDFDKLTEGGGLFNTVAKGAINIHRLNLQIFYYLPINIFQTMATIPQQLLVTPPILCIISLVIRQTAKLVFGAKIPEPAAGKKDTLDVLAMMKQSRTM